MYVAPRVTDFGRIELHTYHHPGSSCECDEHHPEVTGGDGGGGIGFGLIGALGSTIVFAGRGNDQQDAAAAPPPDEEVEKAAQK